MISVGRHRECASIVGRLRRWQVIGLAAFVLAGDQRLSGCARGLRCN